VTLITRDSDISGQFGQSGALVTLRRSLLVKVGAD
jgi:hypothetical protein